MKPNLSPEIKGPEPTAREVESHGGSVRLAVETGKPKLLEVVRERLRAQYYALRTEEAYLGWIRRYVAFHGKRHPRELGEREVAAFLTDLAVNEKVSASTQNQAFSAVAPRRPFQSALLYAKQQQG